MRPKSQAFEIKNVDLSTLSFIVKHAHLADIELELEQKLKDSPDFYGNAPTIIDLDAMESSQPTQFDLQALCALLTQHHLNAVLFKAKSATWKAQAKTLGLIDVEDFVNTPPAAKEIQVREVEVIREVEVVREIPSQAVPTANSNTLVITKPLRSGQHVYAKGGDLIVLAMVNPGAEIMADGHIHVYAPLRGKAIAGAKGNENARIFASCLEAELLSIAGTYRTSDTPLPQDVQSKSAQIYLDGEKLVMLPLS